jgi:membrane-bound lytic murein transglycosylase B
MRSNLAPQAYPDDAEPMLLTPRAGREAAHYTFQGKTQSISAWAREYGISRSVLKHRLQRAEWPIAVALTLPTTPPSHATTVSRDFKPDHRGRVNRRG